MSPLLAEARKYIGTASPEVTACDVIEAGGVRRYAQAIQNEDPIFATDCANNRRYGGPVAPPLYPTHLFRREFGAPDPVQLNAGNPDYDGSMGTLSLPEIEPLRGYALLNGGIDVEFLRYARHGEAVSVVSRYADVTEKQTSKGALFVVVVESEFRTREGELLVRTRRSYLRRK